MFYILATVILMFHSLKTILYILRYSSEDIENLQNLNLQWHGLVSTPWTTTTTTKHLSNRRFWTHHPWLLSADLMLGMTVAKRLILMDWKSVSPPSFQRWLADMTSVIQMARLRSNSTGKVSGIWTWPGQGKNPIWPLSQGLSWDAVYKLCECVPGCFIIYLFIYLRVARELEAHRTQLLGFL